MPGRKICPKQEKVYMTCRSNGLTQETSALKAGFSIRSGRNIEKKKDSKGTEKGPRPWRTRTTALTSIFESEIEPLLIASPSLSCTMILEHIQDKLGGEAFPRSLERTLQRMVHDWRVLHGPAKQAIFRQTHLPGEQGLSDFTQLKNVSITIQGQPFAHLLYHFRLAYSGWSYIEVIEGFESFAALSTGFQNAVQAFGAVPKEHRTDSLSAAFRNCEAGTKEDQTTLYEELAREYGFKPSRNNRGVAHENGSIESPHGHIKSRIKHSLSLRKSCDFESIEEYRKFIAQTISRHNDRNAKNIEEERAAMLPLPKHRSIEYKSLRTKVLTTSTIQITTTVYSVPSQFIGRILVVHVYHNRLKLYWKGALILEVPRVFGRGSLRRAQCIDYKHLIPSLVAKPRAFASSQLRESILPSPEYRALWKTIVSRMERHAASHLMVGLLNIAAKKDCEVPLEQAVSKIFQEGHVPDLRRLEAEWGLVPHKEVYIPPLQHPLLEYDQFMPA